MEMIDYFLFFISTLLSNVFILQNYKLYDKSCKPKISKFNICCVMILFAIIGCINFFLNMSILRTLVSLLAWFLQNLFIYKEVMKKCFLKTLLSYSTYIFFEILFSIIIFSLNISNIEEYFSKMWIVIIYTFIIMIFTYCFTMLLLKTLKKTKYGDINNKNLIIIEILVIVFILLLSYKNVMTFNIDQYLINVILYIIIGIIGLIILKQNMKISDSRAKNKVFLDFMKTYEIQAEKDSEFRHEIFNNLIIMQSFSNKKQVDILIEEILKKYDNKLTNKFKNISKLPEGIKGIIYYKVFELQNEKADVNLHVSKKINTILKKFSVIEYKNIAEVLTILLDNSIEAVKKNKNKEITIDLYVDNNEMKIEISNYINKKIEIKNIEKMGYSTKGKKRGLGLYIARNIVNENKNFDLEYKIENQRFYSIFTIKSKTI